MGALTKARSRRQRLMRERCESGRWFGIRRILVGKIADATAGWHEPEDRHQRKPNNPANWTACQWDAKIFSRMQKKQMLKGRKVLFSWLKSKERFWKGEIEMCTLSPLVVTMTRPWHGNALPKASLSFLGMWAAKSVERMEVSVNLTTWTRTRRNSKRLTSFPGMAALGLRGEDTVCNAGRTDFWGDAE